MTDTPDGKDPKPEEAKPEFVVPDYPPQVWPTQSFPPPYPQAGYPAYPAYPPAPPQPGIIPLRPLQLGDLYAGAWRNIRLNPGVVLGLSLVAMLVITAVQIVQLMAQGAALGGRPPGATVLTASIGSTFVSLLVGIVVAVVAVILNGLQVVVQTRAALGRRTSLAEAWERVSPKLGGLVGVSLLVSLIGVAISIVGGLLVAATIYVAGSGGAAIGVTVLVFLATLVGSIYVGVLLAFAAPAYVLERIGVVDALRRSVALVAGQWWRIFGILLLTALMLGAIALVVLIPFTIAGSVAAYASGGQSIASALIAVFLGVLVVGTFLLPFIVGVLNLLYIDTRIRRERFDLDLARAAAEGTELA